MNFFTGTNSHPPTLVLTLKTHLLAHKTAPVLTMNVHLTGMVATGLFALTGRVASLASTRQHAVLSGGRAGDCQQRLINLPFSPLLLLGEGSGVRVNTVQHAFPNSRPGRCSRVQPLEVSS